MTHLNPELDPRFSQRLDHLRQRKQEQTNEKRARLSNMDEDDYGNVLPPEDFQFATEFNDPEHQTFYGARMWGRNFRRLLERHPLYVDPQDALAGRWMVILQRLRPFTSAVSSTNMEMAPIFGFDHLKPTQEKYGIMPGIGKMHHFAPDYQIGLDLGLDGLLSKVRHYAAQYPDRTEFYHAEEDVLFGIRTWIARTIDEIRRLEALETDPLLKKNLHDMGDVNERLLDHPPATFREVCQFIAWINMANRTYDRAGSGMQLDVMLLPFYRRDLEAGILTEEEARFILSCLLLNDPTYYQIGGPDEQGNDVTNELSYLILEAAHDIKIAVNLTIRVHEKLDPGLLRRGVEILFEDRLGCPRFAGMPALIKGFMKNGYPVELARRRMMVGCHWQSLPGLEYTLNDLIKINLAKVFEVAFWEMMEADEKPSVARLYAGYQQHLAKAVECVEAGIDHHFKNQHLNAPELLLNLLCHGPIERGLDVSNGGVDYYNIGVDGAALATVADSFAALEQRIEQEGRFTWQECAEALRANFENEGGAVIQALMKTTGRFGHGGTLGDKWALEISRDFTDRIACRHTPNGYLMIPGLFSWANTVMLGEKIGATPNGRKAGAPISHGANPDPGFRKDGAFSAMSSAIAAVQPGYGNTAPFQLELNSTITSRDDAIDAFIAVIKAHFDEGGTLINANIVSREQILEAHKNPDAYPNLVVRVTGFTAYFATLTREFRQLVVDRVINE